MAKAELKTDILMSRCTPSLTNDLEAEAKKRGKKPAYLIRLFVEGGLNGDIQIQDYTPLVNALHDLGLNMGRVGGNLNQLSHYFNMKNEVDESQLSLVHKSLQQQFREISKMVKEVKNELV